MEYHFQEVVLTADVLGEKGERRQAFLSFFLETDTGVLGATELDVCVILSSSYVYYCHDFEPYSRFTGLSFSHTLCKNKASGALCHQGAAFYLNLVDTSAL